MKADRKKSPGRDTSPSLVTKTTCQEVESVVGLRVRQKQQGAPVADMVPFFLNTIKLFFPTLIDLLFLHTHTHTVSRPHSSSCRLAR